MRAQGHDTYRHRLLLVSIQVARVTRVYVAMEAAICNARMQVCVERSWLEHSQAAHSNNKSDKQQAHTLAHTRGHIIGGTPSQSTPTSHHHRPRTTTRTHEGKRCSISDRRNSETVGALLLRVGGHT